MKDISHSLFWILVLHTANEGHLPLIFPDFYPSAPKSSRYSSISRRIEKVEKPVGKKVLFPDRPQFRDFLTSLILISNGLLFNSLAFMLKFISNDLLGFGGLIFMVYYIISIFIILIDQMTKWLIVKNMDLGDS